MKYEIIHELPGRLRLFFPGRDYLFADPEEIEPLFLELAGIKIAHFNPRTRSLLVKFERKGLWRNRIIELLDNAPLPKKRERHEKTEVEKKKGIAVRSGTLLVARPLIPPPIRPFLSIWGSLPFIRKGISSLLQRRLDVEVLDSAALGAALATRDFGTASMISFLLKLGDYLEEWARGQSRTLLASMFKIGDEWAWVERDGVEVRVAVTELNIGDVLVIRMGSRIPVDGRVVSGEALVNQSSLTGESQAVMKYKGAPVFAGTAIEEGSLRVAATKVGGETRAAQIVRLIEEGEALKAETQNRSEQLADKVVPYSFAISALTYAMTGNANRAAAVLLVDYSCAIKLSTPLVILASMAKAARNKVLVKGGKTLELLAKSDAFVLDKTGTLTMATPRVVAVEPFNGFDRNYILRQVACVEEHFPHPIAVAVVNHAEEQGVHHPEEHAEVEYILAHGIVSQLHGQRILVGSRHFIHEDERIDVAVAESHIDSFSSRGDTVLYVAIGEELAGLVAITDPLRKEAAGFVRDLKNAGIKKVVMLTGDNEQTARTIASQLAIDAYRSHAFPEIKVKAIKDLQQEGYKVAMVGDGINDSPALTHADVGISMKHGAEIAQESCDILLLDESLESLLIGRQIAGDAMKLIDKNFRQIILVNSVVMALAISGILPPILSASLHNLSTITTGVSALRPLREAQN